MDDFSKAMQKKSDLQLVEIVEFDSENYDPTAIVAAKNELEKRGLLFDELEKLRENILLKYKKGKEIVASAEKFKSNIETGGATILDAVNPISAKSFSTKIYIICAFFSITLVAYFIDNYWVFSPQYVGLHSFETIAIILMLSIGVFGLLQYKSYGWISITVFLVYQIIPKLVEIPDILIRLSMEYQDSKIGDAHDGVAIEWERPLFYEFDPKIILIKNLGALIVFGGLFWFFNKPNTMSHYNIDNDIRSKTILFSVVPISVFWILLVYYF